MRPHSHMRPSSVYNEFGRALTARKMSLVTASRFRARYSRTDSRIVLCWPFFVPLSERVRGRARILGCSGVFTGVFTDVLTGVLVGGVPVGACESLTRLSTVSQKR